MDFIKNVWPKLSYSVRILAFTGAALWLWMLLVYTVHPFVLNNCGRGFAIVVLSLCCGVTLVWWAVYPTTICIAYRARSTKENR